MYALIQELCKQAAATMPGIKNPGAFGVRPLTSQGTFKTPAMGARSPKGLHGPPLGNTKFPVTAKAAMKLSGRVSRTGVATGQPLPRVKLAAVSALPKIPSGGLATFRMRALKRTLAKPLKAVAPVAALAGLGTAALGIASLRSPLGAGIQQFARPLRSGVHGAGLRQLRQDVGGGGWYRPSHTVKGGRVGRLRSLMNG